MLRHRVAPISLLPVASFVFVSHCISRSPTERSITMMTAVTASLCFVVTLPFVRPFVRLSVCLSVCPVLASKLKTKRRRKTKTDANRFPGQE